VSLADSMAPGSDDKKALDAPSVSLSEGGGVIRGIGEKFAANPVTGNGSLSIPVATSPGRCGFGPEPSWSYDSGSGTARSDSAGVSHFPRSPERPTRGCLGTGMPRSRRRGPPQLFTYNAHGNTTGIPHLTSMAWDFKDDCPSTGGERLDVPSDDPYARARLFGPGGT